MLSRKALVMLIVVVAVLIRLLPAVAAGRYYSTDVWPLIKSAEKIVGKPDLRFWNHSELGGYHNRWPAVIISGVVYSEITGLDTADFFRFAGVVAVSTCLALSAYTAAVRVSTPRRASICSLVLIATPSFVVFTAVTLKEVYSYPVAAALVLVALRRPRRNLLLPILVLSLALVVSHPLTPAILASAMVSYVFARTVKEGGAQIGRSEVSVAGLIAALLTAVYVAYGACYSWEGLRYRLGLYDLAVLATVATAVYGWYALNRGSKAWCSLLLAPIVLAATVISSASVVRTSTILYALLPASLLVTLLLRRDGSTWLAVPDSILLPLTTAALYVFLAQPSLMSAVHRVLNYVVCAAALAPVLVKSGSKFLALLQLTVLLAGMGVSTAALTFGDSTTYYWVYREAEVSALKLSPRFTTEVCGDAKIQYLMEPEVKVGVTCGVEVLRYSRRSRPLVLYADNFRYGYVLSPVDTYPVRSFEQVSSNLDLLYSNLYLFIWG